MIQAIENSTSLAIQTLGPREEAGRLWRGAVAALTRANKHFASLCEALDLGLRSIEILAVEKLAPVRQDFPASIAMLLESPNAKVDPVRDAVHTPKSLTFINLVDMLSHDALECVSPKLHHGWEDRRCSCLRSRNLARTTLGITLTTEERDHLLWLAAYRNRIFRVPPPVEVVPTVILDAFPILEQLYRRLVADQVVEAGPVGGLSSC